MSQIGLLEFSNSTPFLPITTLINRWFRPKSSSSTETTAKNGLTSQGEFVKGINFNGDAITVDGHTWLSYSDALADGLSTPDVMPTETGIKKLHPAVNRKMRRMFNTVICKSQKLEIIQTLPNGIYDVYLWMMENYAPNHHSMDVSIGSEVVARGIAQLEVGYWVKYGPYRTTISEGTLNVAICTTNPERDAHVMGMTIFKVPSPQK
ncbi:MAG TPA: hypothetical protein V6D50_26905 [Chroococcales cyanobacterium]